MVRQNDGAVAAQRAFDVSLGLVYQTNVEIYLFASYKAVVLH